VKTAAIDKDPRLRFESGGVKRSTRRLFARRSLCAPLSVCVALFAPLSSHAALYTSLSLHAALCTLFSSTLFAGAAATRVVAP
jgi:hypothetical protein